MTKHLRNATLLQRNTETRTVPLNQMRKLVVAFLFLTVLHLYYYNSEYYHVTILYSENYIPQNHRELYARCATGFCNSH